MRRISPIVARMPLIGKYADSLMSSAWLTWLQELVDALNRTPGIVVELPEYVEQDAAIAATPITDSPLQNEGYYRVSWYLHVTQAATTSSSVQLTLRWIEDGVSRSTSGAAIVNGTAASLQSGTAMLAVDDDTNITFETAYASAGATPMEYKLQMVVERLI